ncbi:hypothetical protein AB0K60_11420 [Thermopolyspora sp. NPDC052614]|uniref:hypothetical protein n=1 Tax=Thermopolyspora sp. NPDC052614 TaxID=3155682 RepID=UPI0034230A04
MLRRQRVPIGDRVLAEGSGIAWTRVYGAIDFEPFGMYRNVVVGCAAAFDHGALCVARMIGLPLRAGRKSPA